MWKAMVGGIKIEWICHQRDLNANWTFFLKGIYELPNQNIDQSYWYKLVMNIRQIPVTYDHSKGIGKFQWKDFGGKKPLFISLLFMNHVSRTPVSIPQLIEQNFHFQTKNIIIMLLHDTYISTGSINNSISGSNACLFSVSNTLRNEMHALQHPQMTWSSSTKPSSQIRQA